MNKKYQIVNSRSDEDCTIFYVLYIVLILVIVFIVYKIILNFSKIEGFELISDKKLSPEQIVEELKEKNNELNNLKNTLQNKLEEQSTAIYISQNFNKVDSSSFDDELTFLLVDFANTKLPEIDLDKKKILETNIELDNVLSEVSGMKNFYKPGDIVESGSTFGITRNDICYRHNGKPIKPTSDFITQYPNCMVCSVENKDTLEKSNAWANTKTNINKVCLYNPNAEANSGIPNMEQCQNFCGVSK
jgi:hypothetical protein